MQAIRCIKLFAWEGRITDKVAAIRSTQLHYRLRYVILQVTLRAISDSLPFIVMLATLSMYTLYYGHSLTPAVAFTMLALIRVIQDALDLFATFLGFIVRAYVSLRRLDAFLGSPV